MNILLLILAMSPQQLTWYELYERGEKNFQKQEYARTMDDMRAALEKNPNPGKNQFTRAVQKIDYKPYYYLALCQFHRDNLPEAYELAQKAFAGEVVSESPKLQANLAPILEAYRDQVQAMHQRYTAEEALISQRSDLIASLSRGETVEVARFLDDLDNEEMFKDIRMYLGLLENWRMGRDAVQTDVLNQMNRWLDAGEGEKARQLFESLKNHLPQDAVTTITARLEALSEPEPAEDNPAPPVEEGPVEDPSEPEDAYILDPSIIEFYRDELARVEQQKKDLDQQVASINSQNRELRGELEDKKAAQPAFTPELVLNLFSEDRGIRVEGHAVSPMLIKSWELLVNGASLAPPPSAFSKNGSTHRLEFSWPLDRYGSHEVEVTVMDEMERHASRSETIVLPVPWWLNKTWWALAAVLIAAWIGFRMVVGARRRRKAKLLHFNPYIAGSPVRAEEMFYGRDQLLHRIQGLVHKNSFMIHGDRRIGKTSLLFQLNVNLEALDSNSYKFFPVQVDLQGVHEPDLFHHMMADVVSRADDWELNLEELTFREVNDHYQSRQFSRDMKRIIHFLRDRHPQHVMVVLLMDEVDVLNEFSEKTNQKLRGIFMKDYAEHLTCVMAGIHLKKEWDSSGSPWYNFFEEIPIKAIDEEEAVKLILDPVRGIFQYSREAVRLIIKETGCHPYLIQKTCVSLIGAKLNTGKYKISREDVTKALAGLNEEIKRSRA